MAYKDWRTISVQTKHKLLLLELGDMFENIPQHLIIGTMVEKLHGYIGGDKAKLSDFIYGKEKITI